VAGGQQRRGGRLRAPGAAHLADDRLQVALHLLPELFRGDEAASQSGMRGVGGEAVEEGVDRGDLEALAAGVAMPFAAVDGDMRALPAALAPGAMGGPEFLLGAGHRPARLIDLAGGSAEAHPEDADEDVPSLDGEVIEDDPLRPPRARRHLRPDEKLDRVPMPRELLPELQQRIALRRHIARAADEDAEGSRGGRGHR
jgi:hypothetical protein